MSALKDLLKVFASLVLERKVEKEFFILLYVL
jgi:hypothetical protein